MAKAEPAAIALPVDIITYRKNRVPKNSSKNLFVMIKIKKKILKLISSNGHQKCI
jgi:hypothetical protein